MLRRYLPRSTEDLINWYERYISPVSLLIGFTIDAIALHVLDIRLYSFVLLFHLSLAASGILLLQLMERGIFRQRYLVAIAKFIPVVVQYSFGNLFSGFILLYSQSAAYATSWIFVVLLAGLLLLNERFRRVYTTFPVQVGILYFGLYSFLIFFTPLITGSISVWMFLISGVASLVVISIFFAIAASFTRSLVAEHHRLVVRVVVGIFACVNAFYFLGVIPPLPLALKDVGVFHSLQKVGNTYEVTYEPRAWYEFYLRYNPVFHRTSGESIYVYTAVFAPSGISAHLAHEWQRFDEEGNEWITIDTTEFPIQGGREGGYRGYTLQKTVTEGKWRVNVRTGYGQLVGRVAFEVEQADERPHLEVGTR